MREEGSECPFCALWPETVTKGESKMAWNLRIHREGKRVQDKNQTERKKLWPRRKLEELAHLKLN